MRVHDSAIEQLLDRAENGSDSAVNELMTLYRARLTMMVESRLEQRLSARVDPSDVVQEACIEAIRRLPDYLHSRPLPFYVWLRGLAVERLIDLRRRHMAAAKRSVYREAPGQLDLPNRSTMSLVNCLTASASSASKTLQRQENKARIHKALAQLDPIDREILLLRYLEEFTSHEISEMLGLTDRAIRRRHRLSLVALSTVLSDLSEE